MPLTRRIALDIGQFHFLEVYRASACRGVLRYAQTHGRWELLYNDHHFSLMGKFRRLEDLPKLGAQGIIMSSCDERKWGLIQKLGIPAVTLSNDYPQADIPAVFSDDEQAGRLGAAHFLERGFRSLGFCGSTNVAWDMARRQGFSAAAQAQGLTPLFLDSHHKGDAQHGRRAAARLSAWVRNAPKPFAVLGADDIHGFQVIEAARRIGLRVPHDVAVLGIDNNLLVCASTRPALSSIEQDVLLVGYRAAQLLDEMLDGAPPPAKPLLIPPRSLHVRTSSDVLAVGDPVLGAALEFITDHLTDSIGAVEIAQAAGVSRRTLETRFSNQLHTTINTFLRNRRMEKAKALLLDPHLSVNEVARLSGFQTASYFCTTFREATGATPAEWRTRAEA